MARPLPAASPPQPIAAPSVALRLTIPEHIFKKYLASARGGDVEDYIVQHLCQTAAWDHSGAAIHFNAPEAVRLCKVTGRPTTTDSAEVLRRLDTLVTFHANGQPIKLVLDAEVLARIDHNSDVRRKKVTPTGFIEREARNGVREAVGLGRLK
jgi:hypothetical protein